jgi:hypothetical protein
VSAAYAIILSKQIGLKWAHPLTAFRDRAYDLTVALRELCEYPGKAFHKLLAAARYGIVLDVDAADIAVGRTKIVLFEEPFVERDNDLAILVCLQRCSCLPSARAGVSPATTMA